MTAFSFFLSVKLRGFTASLAVAPVPELGFVLQVAGLGAAIGSAVALRARRRDPEVDAWRIATAWGTLGMVVGAVIVVSLAL